MNPSDPEDKLAAIKEALFQGRKVEAIKLYRESLDCGLKDAKTAVDRLEGELRASSPEKFRVPAGGKGCLGVIALVCGIVAVALVKLLTPP